jgi:hypothetical protein
MQSGVDDGMILKIIKQRYKNQTDAEFKRFYWWKAVRYQPKVEGRVRCPIHNEYIYLFE